MHLQKHGETRKVQFLQGRVPSKKGKKTISTDLLIRDRIVLFAFIQQTSIPFAIFFET